MPLYQNSVLNKYLKQQDSEAVSKAHKKFSKHFLNPEVQEGIRGLKEEQYQGEFLDGFKTLEEQIHILTHPVIGYYDISDKELGTYEIWHPIINLKEGRAKKTYFEFFERLGLLNKSEMEKPHSVLIVQKIEFDILLPPRRLKKIGNNI